MIKFNITKDLENNTLKVVVSVPDDKHQWWTCELKDVESYLRENHISHGKCIHDDYACSHMPKWEGTFLFELKEKESLKKIIPKKVVDKTPSNMVSSNKAKRTKKVGKAKDD
jgi:hypothetical protein